MRSRSRISLVVVLAALGGMLAAVTRDRARSPLRVAVLTYNTHLLPRVGERFASRRGRGDYRARTIGRLVAPHDLVGLCEVFDPRYRQALIDSAQAEAVDAFHVVWTKKPPGVGFANSGLLLLSRFAIEENHAITYADASRFSTHGFRADAFAAKGAIHARLRLRAAPALRLDCFLTHLESRSASARAGQLRQLADFMHEHADPARPALLMGDLNVTAGNGTDAEDDSPYARLTAELARSGIRLTDVGATRVEAGGGSGAVGTSNPLSPDGGNRIDYIWVSCGSGGDWRLTASDVEVIRFLDVEVPEGSLSDHSGVGCRLEFR